MTYDLIYAGFPPQQLVLISVLPWGISCWDKKVDGKVHYVARSVNLDTAANVDPVNIHTVQCCISSKVFVFHMFVTTEKNIYKLYKSTNAL